jgi:hypothetical protein
LSFGFSRIALVTYNKTEKCIAQSKQKCKLLKAIKNFAPCFTWNIGVIPDPPANIPNPLTCPGWYLKRPYAIKKYIFNLNINKDHKNACHLYIYMFLRQKRENHALSCLVTFRKCKDTVNHKP